MAIRGNGRRHPLRRCLVRECLRRISGLFVCGRCSAPGRPSPTRNPRSARTASSSVITPRTTRLVRAADLRSFRSILAALATEGSPFDARNRVIVVPTRAAAHHLLRSIEDGLREPGATILPDMVTRAELHDRLFERAPQHMPLLTVPEREALLTVACEAVVDTGVKPPFRIRPGLVGAMLEFFDSLKRHQKSVNDFERLAIG